MNNPNKVSIIGLDTKCPTMQRSASMMSASNFSKGIFEIADIFRENRLPSRAAPPPPCISYQPTDRRNERPFAVKFVHSGFREREARKEGKRERRKKIGEVVRGGVIDFERR